MQRGQFRMAQAPQRTMSYHAAAPQLTYGTSATCSHLTPKVIIESVSAHSDQLTATADSPQDGIFFSEKLDTITPA